MLNSLFLASIFSTGVDDGKKFTPRRVVWRSNKFTSVYTDHFPMEIILTGMPSKKNNAEKGSNWNVCKPGGWVDYKRLTDLRAKNIDIIVENDELSVDAMIKKI